MIETIQCLVAEELNKSEQLILGHLKSEVELANTIGSHIIVSGGKRMRPLLALLAAGSCGTISERHIVLAAVVEYLHTASMLHDDVIDDSGRRRGLPTANSNWGNASSVLAGDLIYANSFAMLVELGEPQVMKQMARATCRLAEGEIEQLQYIADPTLDEVTYLRIIENKTASLFEATTCCSAILSGTDSRICKALTDFGRSLGIAFQLIDDLLDYRGDSTSLGKNVGDDLREAKVTLPLIYLLRNAGSGLRSDIEQLLKKRDHSLAPQIIREVQGSDAADYVINLADQYGQQATEALGQLPDSDYSAALEQLLALNMSRSN